MKIKNTYKYKMNLRSTAQSGFSLVELMIASTLGIFILGGVITTFTGTKDSEKMRSTISEMDANARIAIEILRRNIALAGYSSMRNIPLDKPFYSARDEVDEFTSAKDRACGDGSQMHTSGATPGSDQYTADSNNDTGRGDVLTSVYLADNPCREGLASCPNVADINPKAMVYADCVGGGSLRDVRSVACSTDAVVGMPNSTQAKIYNTFYLGSGTEAERHTLYCQGNRGGAQPMVENVEFLQFLYGVTRADGNTEFHRATEVEANDEWSYVTSVRVGLLIRSSQNVLKEASTKDRYILFDRNVPVTDLHRLFRTYTTTINLPNRNRGAVL